MKIIKFTISLIILFFMIDLEIFCSELPGRYENSNNHNFNFSFFLSGPTDDEQSLNFFTKEYKSEVGKNTKISKTTTSNKVRINSMYALGGIGAGLTAIGFLTSAGCGISFAVLYGNAISKRDQASVDAINNNAFLLILLMGGGGILLIAGIIMTAVGFTFAHNLKTKGKITFEAYTLNENLILSLSLNL